MSVRFGHLRSDRAIRLFVELHGDLPILQIKQGRSGLGIEAQREALERFAAAEGFTLGRVFVEVETGKEAVTRWSAGHSWPLPLMRRAASAAQWL